MKPKSDEEFLERLENWKAGSRKGSETQLGKGAPECLF